MMHENNPEFAWWFERPQDERDLLDRSARNSILNLPSYPFWSAEIAAELAAWKTLENEVAQAHIDWLSKLKARADRRGRVWDRAEFLRQARLTEAGD
ncbi:MULTISPECIES: hypothetical protein [Gordonia]|uniref:hypothetical protein n=1 Tax=Gordonia TaxID=2053 RepID=UPI0007EBB583|nr:MULTISPECIES: hypothetical protein [Gordonia]OBA57867.1 hypothetical protein A5777_06675 [Gordonia sp. 852002-10350_SCH5691597]